MTRLVAGAFIADELDEVFEQHRERQYTRDVKFPVSEACVARSGEKAKELQDTLGFVPWEILPGYRCFGIDGNVLAKTDKRQGVLRDTKTAPLPGKAIARFDLHRLHREYVDQGLVILGIHSTKGAEDAEEYIESNNIPWAIVTDDSNKSSTTYAVRHLFIS